MFNAMVSPTDNAALYLESTQTQAGPVELTDLGDHQTFTSAAELWSKKTGYAPQIYPNGVSTGCYVFNRTTNDKVYVSAGTAYQGGLLIDVAALEVTCTRTADAVNPCIITSVVIDATGVVNVNQGLKGAALSTTRGNAGGPPILAAQEIELGQVKYTSETSAPVAAEEIFQLVGVHRERFDFPGWETYTVPSRDGTIAGGSMQFVAALGDTHIASPKHIYAHYAEPSFTQLNPISNFSPPTRTHSLTSVPIYGGALGIWSTSLTQGSFSIYLINGVSDWVFGLQDTIATLRFCPDMYGACMTVQGMCSVKATFPAGQLAVATVTLTCVDGAIFPR